MLCAGCVPLCERGALTVTETHLEVDDGACTRCGACVRGCPTGALCMKNRGTGEPGNRGVIR